MTERKDKNTIKAKNKEQVEIEKQQLPWRLNHHSHEAFGGFEEIGLLKLNMLEASVLFLLTSNEWKLSCLWLWICRVLFGVWWRKASKIVVSRLSPIFPFPGSFIYSTTHKTVPIGLSSYPTNYNRLLY